jgi:hypothetical protein
MRVPPDHAAQAHQKTAHTSSPAGHGETGLPNRRLEGLQIVE